MDDFLGHYVEWRQARLNAMVEHYGRNWFLGKRILELGCGHGYMGINLALLGADVTFSDGRQKHLDEIARHWPCIHPAKLVHANLEHEWPFNGPWDMILHQGLLYHLFNWKHSLLQSAMNCEHLVLESEVLDSDNPQDEQHVMENARALDQALEGNCLKVTSSAIEDFLLQCDMRFDRDQNPVLDIGEHRYSWKPRNSKRSSSKTRRWWWCWKEVNHGIT